MCGILGILSNGYVAQEVYDGLVTLQHRGQDATGMITYDGHTFHTRKDLGLVNDVFHTRHMKKLQGYAGIGHTRYSTIGGGSRGDSQPFIGQAPYGVALGHNGNLFNSHELKQELFEKDHRLVNSDNDGEVVLNLLTKALTKQNADQLKPEHIWKAVESVYKRARGAYSAVGYIARHGMFGFRDPHGIRPLLFGKRDQGLKTEYIFCSESIAMDILGFEFVKDVGPGEAIFVDEKTRKYYSKKIMPKKLIPCIFEYIYFARPDSILNGISVYKSQIRMGEKLARKIRALKLDIDVVMPVPDSSRSAALAIADKLNLRYREGLVKNRYIGRTFIMPGQAIRKKSIRYKLNPMKLEIEGKKILLIDDSIVRGNTSREIIKMVRNAGAKKVYMGIFSPPVKSPCVYGIDIPTREELIASSNTVEQIRKYIGADGLYYLDVKDIVDACKSGNPAQKEFCTACFDGKYKTGDVNEEVLKKVAESRLAEKCCDPLDDESFIENDESPAPAQLNLVE